MYSVRYLQFRTRRYFPLVTIKLDAYIGQSDFCVAEIVLFQPQVPSEDFLRVLLEDWFGVTREDQDKLCTDRRLDHLRRTYGRIR